MLDVKITHVFKGFSLDVALSFPNGISGLSGPSGAGKTTILQAISGVLRPDHGCITLAGETLFDSSLNLHLPAYLRRIGYVFQEPRLFPHLSLRHNLLYGRWFARKRPSRPNEPDFDQVCDLLGLGPLLGRGVQNLSGGEKSRVALARALLSKPRALLLDEPLAALDNARKAEILPYLQRLRGHIDLPIVFISHSPEELAVLADRIFYLETGRIVKCTPSQVNA